MHAHAWHAPLSPGAHARENLRVRPRGNALCAAVCEQTGSHGLFVFLFVILYMFVCWLVGWLVYYSHFSTCLFYLLVDTSLHVSLLVCWFVCLLFSHLYMFDILFILFSRCWPGHDRKYKALSVREDALPFTESLHDTLLRCMPCWEVSLLRGYINTILRLY